MTDASLKPDPRRKGSYYRRIKDIRPGLETLGVATLPPGPKFIAYYFSCEKLARGVVGIVDSRPAKEQFRRGGAPSLECIKFAVNTKMGLNFPDSELTCMFDIRKVTLPSGVTSLSARLFRNKLAHDFGPSRARKLLQAAPIFNPMMERFLNCADDVLAYLKGNFSHVP